MEELDAVTGANLQYLNGGGGYRSSSMYGGGVAMSGVNNAQVFSRESMDSASGSLNGGMNQASYFERCSL